MTTIGERHYNMSTNTVDEIRFENGRYYLSTWAFGKDSLKELIIAAAENHTITLYI